jgi:hypothetical protein
MSFIFNNYTAFYATSTVVESVRKAQEENAAAILSRALQVSKDKMVIKPITSQVNYFSYSHNSFFIKNYFFPNYLT